MKNGPSSSGRSSARPGTAAVNRMTRATPSPFSPTRRAWRPRSRPVVCFAPACRSVAPIPASTMSMASPRQPSVCPTSSLYSEARERGSTRIRFGSRPIRRTSLTPIRSSPPSRSSRTSTSSTGSSMPPAASLTCAASNTSWPRISWTTRVERSEPARPRRSKSSARRPVWPAGSKT